MALKELAKLLVRIRAPREELRSDLEGAKQDVQQFGTEADKAAGSVNAKLEGVGKSIRGQTRGIRSIVGAVTGVIGAATRILGIIGLITAGVAGMVTLVRTLAGASEEVAEAERKAAEWTKQRNEALRDIERRKEQKPEPSADDKQAEAIRKSIVDRAQSLADYEKKVKSLSRELATAQRRMAELARGGREGAFMSSSATVGALKTLLAQAESRLKELRDQDSKDRAALERFTSAQKVIRVNEEHEQQMRNIRVQEDHRLKLRMENEHQFQQFVQSLQGFNNQQNFDVRRLERVVKQIHRRLN